MATKYYAGSARLSRWEHHWDSLLLTCILLSRRLAKPIPGLRILIHLPLQLFDRPHGTTMVFSRWSKPSYPCGLHTSIESLSKPSFAPRIRLPKITTSAFV